MPDTVGPIDRTTFSELQATTGADFVVELVGTFFEEAPQMLGELHGALAAGDAERFRRAAHSLKTNACTFGAAALGAAARRLEHEGLPAGASGIGTLQVLYDEAAAALEELIRG